MLASTIAYFYIACNANGKILTNTLAANATPQSLAGTGPPGVG